MDKDSRLLFEAYGKSKLSYTPVNSDYIYFLDDEELYQTNPMKRLGTGEKYLKQAFPNGYKKVRVSIGEEIHDVVPGNNIDLGTQSDKLFVVDDTFPEESSFPALISSPSENAEGTKVAKIYSKDVWELSPPLKATESRWPDANLTSRGEMKQFPVTVEYLHLQRNRDGSFDAIDAEDPSRSTVINLPLPQGFNPKASFEEVLKALGYTVTEKDGQTQLGLGENAEDESMSDADFEEQFFEILANLKYGKPELFDKFVKRLDDKNFVRMMKNMSGLSM